MNRTLYIAVLVIPLAVISWFLADREHETNNVYTPSQNEPDYWVEGMDLTEMGPLGKPKHRLKALKTVHFAGDDSTELTIPRLTLFDPDKPPWQINSNHGWISSDKTLVVLTDEVLVERQGEGDIRPLQVRTSELRIKPQERYAESDRHVRVDSHSNWLESDGMQVWFEEPVRMKFLSRVKARYEVN